MPNDPARLTEFLERLSLCGPVTARAMFGGHGLYLEGRFFALVADNRLYLKVGDLNRADYEAAGSQPFYPWDSPTPMGYWQLPASVLEDDVELPVWVDKSLAVAEAAARKKRR